MRITVDRTRCIGSGMCALTVPEVFDQDEVEGKALVLDPNPAPDRHGPVREAEITCPAAAITVAD
ncbi:ferredoxin [Nocardia panacis]|uniref:Ferredoxin n=1 Tax=Nocardia panacis TaxID=2340916 RepID=A0A3A4K5E7_9NOCA|nr:ferredoxin [Nocardia panacis]RJO75811.1 ferredoxin [Nocardia panacis]